MLEFIEKNRENMIKDIADLVSFPSVSGEKDEYGIFGKPVADALKKVKEIAERLGLSAEELGYATKATIGSGKEEFLIVGHADVVPAGEGWTKEPYALTREDGRLYGRGVLDDKGAVIVGLYALAALKASGKTPKMRVSVIAGGDEEQGMSDMKTYVKEYGLPDYALTPDASFPITNAELGYIFGKYVFENVKESGKIRLISINGGRAINCVPEKCEFKIEGDKEVFEYIKSISNTLMSPEISYENGIISVLCRGISAHGSIPHEGRSAIMNALRVIEDTFAHFNSKNSFLDFTSKYIKGTKGEALGINCSDEFSGELSVNFGICSYENNVGEITIDSRTPISVDAFKTSDKLVAIGEKEGGKYVVERNGNGIRIADDTPFMQSVAKSYEKVVGEKCGFNCERGSTYAKAFNGKCVAFGPANLTDKNECGNEHSPDEYISEEIFIRTAKIYAQVIADFCC